MTHDLHIVFDTSEDFLVEVGEHRLNDLVGYISDFAVRIFTRAYREAKGVCCEKKKAQKKKKLS